MKLIRVTFVAVLAMGAVLVTPVFADADRGTPMAVVSGGEFESVLPIAPGQNRVRVKTFGWTQCR